MKTINKVLSKIETELQVQEADFMFNNKTNIGIVNTFTDCTLNQKICDLIFLKRSNIKSEVPILTTYYN
jgi:hypothetical protein